MQNQGISQCTLLKNAGAALAGLTALRVASPTQALRRRELRERPARSAWRFHVAAGLLSDSPVVPASGPFETRKRQCIPS
jgi:hypothetical protein